MAKIKVGLVGTGPWARVLFRNLVEHPEFEVVAVAGRNPFDGVSSVPGWEELLTLPLEGLVVATRPQLNAEIIRGAWAKDLPALVEKPLTLNGEQARELLETARSSKPPLTLVNHIHLYHPFFRDLLNASRPSGPIEIETRGGGAGPFREYMSPIWDYGAHDISMIFSLLRKWGEDYQKTKIEVATVRTPDVDGKSACNAEMTLSCGDSIKIRLSIGNGFPKKERIFTLHTTEGERRYDAYSEAASKTKSPLRILLDEFAEGVTHGERIDLDSFTMACDVVGFLEKMEARCGTKPVSGF